MLTHIPIKMCDCDLQTCDIDFHSIADSIYDFEDFAPYLFTRLPSSDISTCPKWIFTHLHKAISDSHIHVIGRHRATTTGEKCLKIADFGLRLPIEEG